MNSKVAVYGSLKQGFYNHMVMEQAKGKLVSTERWYGFNMHSLIHYPGVVEGEGSIEVEVYEVRDLAPLDRLEGHPTFYKRTKYKGVWLYMYQGSVEGVPLVESGVWEE